MKLNAMKRQEEIMTNALEKFVRPNSLQLQGAEWFSGAGFGIFVHWDHASQQELEISWPLVGRELVPGKGGGPVTVEQYQSSASTFNPIKWDAGEVARLAKRAGATYVVFTARHHAGYSMFHSRFSEFGIEHSPFKRDIVREFVEAVRAEGLRVGLYYSLSDWNHPDYPAFRMEDRPYPAEFWPKAGRPESAGLPEREDRHRRPTPEQWARYQDYLRGQLTELITNYGKIDLLWFDGEWERSEVEWDSAGLRRLVKSLQPDIVINDRLQGHGDYETPEQGFPLEVPAGPWELCLTIGDVWAWSPDETRNKSARSILNTLIDVTSLGGNLLLNIGPKGDGTLNQDQIDRLEEIGRWMEKHRESVIGVSPTNGISFYGPTTARNETLYLHLVMTPVDEVIVRGCPVGRISKVRLLATDEQLEYEVNLEVHDLIASGSEKDKRGELRISAPTPSGALIDVIAVDFE